MSKDEMMAERMMAHIESSRKKRELFIWHVFRFIVWCNLFFAAAYVLNVFTDGSYVESFTLAVALFYLWRITKRFT